MEHTFTGVCICEHSFEDHHHGMIMQPQLMIDRGDVFRNIDGVLGEECEATQFEGMFTPDVSYTDEGGNVVTKHYDEMCECRSYWDKGWGKRE